MEMQSKYRRWFFKFHCHTICQYKETDILNRKCRDPVPTIEEVENIENSYPAEFLQGKTVQFVHNLDQAIHLKGIQGTITKVDVIDFEPNAPPRAAVEVQLALKGCEGENP